MESSQQSQPKLGVVKRLAAKCSRHGTACLAIIIVLVIVVIAQRVYYCGFLMFGPYASSLNGAKPKKKQMDKGSAAQDEGKTQTDSETADLIQSINSAGSE